eukprot:9339255-Lingulodinium_polyedra.AAC.1
MDARQEGIPVAQEVPVVESPLLWSQFSTSGDTMLHAIEETVLASVSEDLNANSTKESDADSEVAP